jgi:hypothetical protein
MAPTPCGDHLVDLPLEVLTHVCRHLGLHDLVQSSRCCKRFRHGGLNAVELPTEPPVVTALRELAFPRPELVPIMRPTGCSESWVAYLARCVRQRRCREAPPIAAGEEHSLCVRAGGRLLACGEVGATSAAEADGIRLVLAPILAKAGVRVQSVAARWYHSLALTWDGRVYSWGVNNCGQLSHGDELHRPSPALVEGFEGMGGIAAAGCHSLAVMESGKVFNWGGLCLPGGWKHELRPIIVERFGGVRVRRVYAGLSVLSAIGENGELFSWGGGGHGLLGHGDEQNQPSPKRVEALQGVRVSSVSAGSEHALALSEDGMVYLWGENAKRAVLRNPDVEREPLPKPVEALCGVRVGSVAAEGTRSYAVADTGELWAWGFDCGYSAQLGHGEQDCCCPLPKPIESLRGIKVDAVATDLFQTLTLADDESMYAWGS